MFESQKLRTESDFQDSNNEKNVKNHSQCKIAGTGNTVVTVRNESHRYKNSFDSTDELLK